MLRLLNAAATVRLTFGYTGAAKQHNLVEGISDRFRLPQDSP